MTQDVSAELYKKVSYRLLMKMGEVSGLSKTLFAPHRILSESFYDIKRELHFTALISGSFAHLRAPKRFRWKLTADASPVENNDSVKIRLSLAFTLLIKRTVVWNFHGSNVMTRDFSINNFAVMFTNSLKEILGDSKLREKQLKAYTLTATQNTLRSAKKIVHYAKSMWL